MIATKWHFRDFFQMKIEELVTILSFCKEKKKFQNSLYTKTCDTSYTHLYILCSCEENLVFTSLCNEIPNKFSGSVKFGKEDIEDTMALHDS